MASTTRDTTPSAATLIVGRTATPFLDFLRTATADDFKDIYLATNKKPVTDEEKDDLTDKFSISQDLEAFRSNAFPGKDQSLLVEDTVRYIQRLSNREYSLAGSTETCTEEDAGKIARSIFYPGAQPAVATAEPVQTSPEHVEDTKGSGCGLGHLFRRLMSKSRSGREESATADS